MRFSSISNVLVFALSAALLSPTLGCGDDAANKTIPVSGLLNAQAAAYCSQAANCAAPSAEPDFFALLSVHAPAGCAEALLRQDPPDVEKWVTDGLVRYNGDKAAICLAAFDSQCAVASGPPSPACDEALVGLVPAGGACEDDIVCAGDARCERGDKDYDCAGVCTTNIPLGGTCDPANYGQDCSRTAGSTTCDSETKVCVLYPATPTTTVAAGEDCGYQWSEGGATDAQCGAGHVCDAPEEDADYVCLPVVAVGGDCSIPSVCAFGSACITTADAATCQAVKFTDVADGPCNETDLSKPVVVCNAFKGLLCSANGACEATTGKNGSKCDGEVVGCDTGFFCDSESSTCKNVKPDGADCGGDSHCESGHCSNDNSCVPLVCE